jgi:hypothetical protein
MSTANSGLNNEDSLNFLLELKKEALEKLVAVVKEQAVR